MLKRAVNVGFSGGEKKRAEILQMAVLEPSLCMLDETDSGLDIDAMRVVADGVNALRSPDRAMIVITHYQRLLDYIVPDHVHVLSKGRIVKSGGKYLALELEAKGYAEFERRRRERHGSKNRGRTDLRPDRCRIARWRIGAGPICASSSTSPIRRAKPLSPPPRMSSAC